jgi:hypothetical protein
VTISGCETEERAHVEFSWALLEWLLERDAAQVRPATILPPAWHEGWVGYVVISAVLIVPLALASQIPVRRWG